MNPPDACAVVVAGAGPAGALAAAAAARAGCLTVLIESAPGPGGTGRTHAHRHLCGLYTTGEAPGDLLHGPLVAEVVDRLRQRTGVRSPQRLGRTWVWPLHEGDLEHVLDELLDASPNLCTLWDAEVTALQPAADGGLRVTFSRDGQVFTLRANTAVDATGQAALARLAGWPREETSPDARQLAGFTLRLDHVAVDPLQALRIPLAVRRACAAGALSPLARHVVFIPTGAQSALLRINVPFDTPPGEAEQAGRAAVETLRTAVAGLEQAQVCGVAGPAPRDLGRVAGRYRLSAADVLEARAPPGAVARGAWPIEYWRPETGPTYRYGPEGRAYDIPLDALLSPRSDRVLFAGRGLSCDPDAFASIRVMGTCMATGEAAGQEAARRAT